MKYDLNCKKRLEQKKESVPIFWKNNGSIFQPRIIKTIAYLKMK